MLKRSALLAVCLSASSWALADQLVLNNGDTLRGKIVSMADGKMVFKSPMLGELKVAMDKVESFSSDKPIKLQLVDGSVVEPQLEPAESGFVKVKGEAGSHLAINQISGINLEPQKAVKWTGKLFAGVNIQKGNTETQDVDIDTKLIRETKGDRVILDARYEEDRSEDDTSGDLTTDKRYYMLGAHYDYFLSERIYLYGDGRTEKENTANLDRRIKLGAGAGYRWVETSRTRFEVESGLSWVSEEFTNNTSDEQYTALRLASRLTHKLTSDINVFNDAEWLLSLADSNDQLFSMDTGMAYKVNGHLSLEAKLRYDWDKSPATGNDKEDFRYVFGASWGF